MTLMQMLAAMELRLEELWRETQTSVTPAGLELAERAWLAAKAEYDATLDEIAADLMVDAWMDDAA